MNWSQGTFDCNFHINTTELRDEVNKWKDFLELLQFRREKLNNLLENRLFNTDIASHKQIQE